MDTFKPLFDPRFQLEAEEFEAATEAPARRLIHDDICLALQRLDHLSGQLRQPAPLPSARH